MKQAADFIEQPPSISDTAGMREALEEARAVAKSAIERLEQAVSLLDDTFFYTDGYHKSIAELTDRFAKIDAALSTAPGD